MKLGVVSSALVDCDFEAGLALRAIGEHVQDGLAKAVAFLRPLLPTT